MEQVSEKKYPLNAADYKLYEEVGEGVSATVHRALCIPLNEIVAIKVLDLEKCNNDLVCGLLFRLFGLLVDLAMVILYFFSFVFCGHIGYEIHFFFWAAERTYSLRSSINLVSYIFSYCIIGGS